MNAFAVIETGGKQYLVEEGSVLKIEKIHDDQKVGDTVSFDKVVLKDTGSDTEVGAPYLADAKVTAEITEIGRGKKVVVIKYKAKSNYFKKRGHRQPFIQVKVTGIK